MKLRLIWLVVGSTLALGSCALTGSTYPDIDADLSELGLFRVPAAAPSSVVSAEEAIQAARDEHGDPIDVLRVGRRIDLEARTLWVVIFRTSGDDLAACECVWSGLTIDDQTGRVHSGFDDLSWRSFRLPPPPWE